MLRPDAVNTSALEQVADDIGELIASPASLFLDTSFSDETAASAESPSHEMTENFAVWVINYDELMQSADEKVSAITIPKPTNRWHHQIRKGGKVTGYARSAGSAADALALRQLFDSEIASNIDNAITLLDELEGANPLFQESEWVVRLLVVPTYQVHAFWLVSENSEHSLLLLIDGPSQLDGLSRRELISLESFVALLRQLQPATGLIATLYPDSGSSNR